MAAFYLVSPGKFTIAACYRKGPLLETLSQRNNYAIPEIICKDSLPATTNRHQIVLLLFGNLKQTNFTGGHPMSNKSTLKPIAAALGVTFVVSMSLSSMATATENPFAMTEFGNSGYMVAGHEAEGKCGEGKCGGEKKEAEGKCGEGKCGAEKKEAEGKCGEGKCGAEKKEAEGKCGEGKCGAEKKEAEGKCGEGKCGGKKSH